MEGEIKSFRESLTFNAIAPWSDDLNSFKHKLYIKSRQNKYSVAYLSVSLTNPAACLSNAEFKASTCRLNVFRHSDILAHDLRRSTSDPDSDLYVRSEIQEKKSLCHVVDCLKDANAQTLHNAVSDEEGQYLCQVRGSTQYESKSTRS